MSDFQKDISNLTDKQKLQLLQKLMSIIENQDRQAIILNQIIDRQSQLIYSLVKRLEEKPETISKTLKILPKIN